jgi:hypothetical protein
MAIKGVKAFITRGTNPRNYRCKKYGGDVPAHCIGLAKYEKRYFFASKP